MNRKVSARYFLGVLGGFGLMLFGQNCGRGFNTELIEGNLELSSSGLSLPYLEMASKRTPFGRASINAGLSPQQSAAAGVIELDKVTIDGLTLKDCSQGDATAFLQKAFDQASNVTLILPENKEYCTKTLYIKNNGISFRGRGEGASVTRLTLAANSGTLLRVEGVEYVTIADFRVAVQTPKETSILFDFHTAKNTMVNNITTEGAINRFGRTQNTNNITFENITIAKAIGGRVFDFAPEQVTKNDKSDVVSVFRTIGYEASNTSIWVALGNTHSVNFHEVSFTGGKHAIHAPPLTGNQQYDTRYFSSQNLLLNSQVDDAINFSSGLSVQIANATINNCGGSGFVTAANFLSQVQLHDAVISKCKGPGIDLGAGEFINIINPKITTASAAVPAIRVGKLSGVNIVNPSVSGTKTAVDSSKCGSTCSGLKISKAAGAWKKTVSDYGRAVNAIYNRRELLVADNVRIATSQASLVSAVNELCSVGGVILMGKSSIELNAPVTIGAHCQPLDIRAASRFYTDLNSPNLAVVLTTANAGFVISGSGHSIRDLQFKQTTAVNNAIYLSQATNILLERNSFFNITRAVQVTTSDKVYFYYNRYINRHAQYANGKDFVAGSEGVLINAGSVKSSVKNIYMMMETGLCTWVEKKEFVENCSKFIGVHVRGSVKGFTAIQSAYIQGGVGTKASPVNANLRPSGIRVFAMGSDNPMMGASFNSVHNLQIDMAWLGQVDVAAIELKGGATTDKTFMNGNMLHSTAKSFNSTGYKGQVYIRGGVYRTKPPYYGKTTNVIANQFDGFSMGKLYLGKPYDGKKYTTTNSNPVPSTAFWKREADQNVYAHLMLGAPAFAQEEVDESNPDFLAYIFNKSSVIETIAETEDAPDMTSSEYEDSLLEYEEPVYEPEENLACTLQGKTIIHGASITAYQSGSVGAGASCTSETRTCNNGTLSGSYNFESCNIAAAASCNFLGKEIPSGTKVTAFENSLVAMGSTCKSEQRTCVNGKLSGTFSHSFCTVKEAAACNFLGTSIAHGASVKAYANSVVSFGSSCQSQVRSCNDGNLSGSYGHSFCNVQAPAACNFVGQTVPHGATVAAYANSVVNFGSSCQKELRSCNNGTLSGSLGHSFCNVKEPASCSFNGVKVQHGHAVDAYETVKKVNGVCKTQRRLCDNGELRGSYKHTFCN